jgi:hypothetical protein
MEASAIGEALSSAVRSAAADRRLSRGSDSFEIAGGDSSLEHPPLVIGQLDNPLGCEGATQLDPVPISPDLGTRP